MENVELVSIIIPVYNIAPYITESLDSVINQTYKNLDIIIIDDGSTDGSDAICNEYAKKDNRVRVVHQENKGLSAARNTGLEMMTGDAVAFLDSDDALHSDYIATMVEAMNREDVDIVICRFTIHNTTGKMIMGKQNKIYPAVKNGIYDRNSALRVLADGTINPGVWNKLYRRKLWKEVCFPVGHVYENVDTIYRVFDLCHNAYVLDKPLYMYRKRPGAITEMVSENSIADWLLARSHFEKYITENTPEVFSEEDLKRFYRSRINHVISFYCELPDSKETVSFKNELRGQVFEIGAKAEIKKCKRFTQVGYKLLCSCPGLLKMIYPLYYRFCQR